MRFLIAPILAAGLLGAAAVQARVGADSPITYIAGLEELPLMRRLEEIEKERVVFDTPAGRIIEAYAAGRVTPAEVETFYENTLAQLGWHTVGPLEFVREGERLVIDFPEGRLATGPGATLKVRFSVKPLEPEAQKR